MRLINFVASNRGWLFEDLKHHLAALRPMGARVLCTETADASADAWVYFRPEEAMQTPKWDRTVCMWHDFFDQPAERMTAYGLCRGVSLIHPRQTAYLRKLGYLTHDRLRCIQPVGYLPHFALRHAMPEAPTVGWVGRDSRWHGKDIKRLGLFVAAVTGAAKRIHGLRVLMVGSGLDAYRDMIEAAGVPCRFVRREDIALADYPALYVQMDVHCITSAIEGEPTCWFESQACGVPSVSTQVGYPALLVKPGVNGYIAETEYGLTGGLVTILRDRATWFAKRAAIRSAVQAYTMQAWCEAQIRLALEVCDGIRD